MKPHLSIILEKVDEYVPMLPLTLIDIDHHLSKLKIPYEVLILSKDGKNREVANKFSRVSKNDNIRSFSERIRHDDIRGEICLAFRSNFVSEFESFRNLVESLNTERNAEGYELVFGAVKDKDSADGPLNALARALGSPIDLRFKHPIIGFTKNLAPVVLPHVKKNDIQLAMFVDKAGFIVGEIPVRFKNREARVSSANSKINLLWELVKIKVIGMQMEAEAREARN